MYKYEEIAHTFEERILNGEYRPGDLLPTGQQVMSDFKVTWTTVARAYDHLEHRRLVEKVRGRGTIVKHISENIWDVFQALAQVFVENNWEITGVRKRGGVYEMWARRDVAQVFVKRSPSLAYAEVYISGMEAAIPLSGGTVALHSLAAKTLADVRRKYHFKGESNGSRATHTTDIAS